MTQDRRQRSAEKRRKRRAARVKRRLLERCAAGHPPTKLVEVVLPHTSEAETEELLRAIQDVRKRYDGDAESAFFREVELRVVMWELGW